MRLLTAQGTWGSKSLSWQGTPRCLAAWGPPRSGLSWLCICGCLLVGCASASLSIPSALKANVLVGRVLGTVQGTSPPHEEARQCGVRPGSWGAGGPCEQ